MSEFNRMDENYTNIDKLFANMRNAVERYEQVQATLQNENKALADANTSLHSAVNRLIGVNNRQQTILDVFHRTLDENKLLKIELNDVKQENVLLKNSSNTLLQSEQQPNVDKLAKYNSLLQNKIVELEKTIVLQNQKLVKQDLSYNDNQVSQLKIKNTSLTIENKLLKEQLSNFRHVHNQIVSEIHLNNLKKYNDHQQTHNNIVRAPSITIDHDKLEQDELQPLSVNVIDDEEDN